MKVSIGPGTIGGTVLVAFAIAGGVVLLLLGKNAEEREAGKALLTLAAPIVGGIVVGGRMYQGKGSGTPETPPADVLAPGTGPAGVTAPELIPPDGVQTADLPRAAA